MKRTNEQQTENALKRFLKKKVAFTASLLVSFLITGGIGLASSAELESKVAATHDTLISSIEAQKAEVQALLDENEARLRQLKLDTDELIRKGEWYSKPVYKQGFPGQPFPAAQQVWFSYWFENAGKSKNKTRSEWKNTIDAIAYRKAGYETEKGINPYAKGEVENGILDSEKNIPEGDKLYDVEINGNIPNGLSAYEAAMAAGVDPYGVLQDGNGVYINNPPWVEELDLGANIKPLSPELPEISKTVNVNVNSPVVTGPIINPINPPSTPTAPTGVTVSVTPPAAVAAINVTPPAAPTPVTPLDKTINTPNEPTIAQFTPKTITPPVAPTLPTVLPPSLPSFDIDGTSGGNGYEVYVFNTSGSRAYVAAVAVTKGTFTLDRTGSTAWTYKIDNYDVTNWSSYANATGSYTTAIGASETGINIPTGSLSSGSQLGFFKGVYDPIYTGKDVTINYTYGTSTSPQETFAREIVHQDTHYGVEYNTDTGKDYLGHTNVKSIQTRLTEIGADSILIADYKHAEEDLNPVGITTPWDKRVNSYINGGNINMKGSNMTVTNQYDHTSKKKTMGFNDGLIVISDGNYNAAFMSAGDNDGGYAYVNYNGSTGRIIVNSGASSAYTFGAFNNTSVKNMVNGNDGLITLSGDGNAYVYRNEHYKVWDGSQYVIAGTNTINHGVTTFYDDPDSPGMAYLFGDNSLGIYILDTATEKVNSGTIGTKNYGYKIAIGGYDSTKFDGSTPTDAVTEGSIGMYVEKQPVELKYTEAHINGSSKKNVGIYAGTGVTSLGDGIISVNGGEENIGIYAHNSAVTTTGALIAGNGKVKQDWASTSQDGTNITISPVDILPDKDYDITTDTTGFGGSKIFSSKDSYAVTPTYHEATGSAINIVAYADGKDITANYLGGMGSQNTVGLLATGATITITKDVEILGMNVSNAGSNAMAAYAATGGKINLVNLRTGSDSGAITWKDTAGIATGDVVPDRFPDIDVKGMATGTAGQYAGIGLVADGVNSIINADDTSLTPLSSLTPPLYTAGTQKPLYIRVTDGGAGVSATNGGIINIRNAVIEVNNGYAIYADSVTNTKVNAQNTSIVLDGDSTAFELGTSHIDSGGSKIFIKSDKVVAFKLPFTGSQTLSAIETAVATAASSISDDGVHTKWKIGALDGITLTINAPITDGASSDSTESGLFFHRLIIQNSKIIVDNDVTVTTDQTHLTKYGESNAIGVVATAAGTPGSKGDTDITVNAGKTISVDRTDIPNTVGAIGAFVNYGTMTNNGTIKAETVKKSKGGIGILAVGGSDVTNAAGGIVTVDGEESIGIGGLEYRSGIGKEFTVTDDITTVTNNGDVSTLGKNGIGMYLYNNAIDAVTPGPGTPVAGVEATNTGTITASGEGGVGMAVKGDGTAADTTVENTGTITVGNKGTGIFVQDAVTVSDMGNMTLGEAANGLVADPNSDVTAIASANLTAATGTKNQTAIVLKGATPGTKDTTPQTVGVTGGITLTGFENASGLYVQDKGAVTSTSAININGGQKNVGIYTNNGDVTSDGNITMDNASVNSVGMYTSNGNITNGATATIQMNEGSQIGMVANGGSANAVNTGTLDMAAQGAVGMLGLAGATITDTNAGGMTFTANKTFGIAADASHVILNGGTLALDNSKEAIYVYANNGSDVTNTAALVINGVTAADPAKSVGIYLDSNGNNTLINNSTIEAQASAVGVYANGDKTLTNGTYTATAGAAGDNTVAVYLSNGGTLDNLTVNANAPTGTAVGVYNAAGTAKVVTGLALNMTDTGTGMYLANGANASGDKITVNNGSATANVGVYYTGGTASHDTDIDIAAVSNVVVGLFANGAATNVTTTKNITDLSSTGIGAMTNDGATVTNSGIITTSTAVASQSVGMYTATGNLKNTGTINVTDGLGVNIDNSGSSGTGKFDGNGGTIAVNGKGAAISLDATVAGQVVDAGTIDLQGSATVSGIGVFAQNNAVVDFPMTLTGNYGTGVYAKAGSSVSGTIDGSTSTGTIGLYTEDATVTVSGATIKAGTQTATADPAIGWYQAGSSQTYTTAGNTIESAGKGSIGTYIANGNTNDSADTYNVGKDGIGVLTYGTYTTNGATFNLNGAGAIGIVSETLGTANIGTTGAINVNFGGNGEILAFADGGAVNLGSLITSTGSGTLAATLNGSLTNLGTLTVENGAYGLVGAYDASRAGYTPIYTISNTGNMTVKSTSVGMATVLSGETGATAPGPADVSLDNSGTMDVDGANSVGMFADVGTVSNTSTMNITNGAIGIYAKGVSAVSSIGTMTVTGATGYVYEGIPSGTAPAGSMTLNAGTDTQRSIGGYYLNIDNNNTIDPPTSLTVAGDYAIPLAIEGGTNKVTGNISDAAGFANSIGLFAKNSTTTVNDVTVTGPQDNIGIYSENAVLTTGTVTVGDSNDPAGNKTKASLGIYANKGSVTTTDVTVGKDSIGLFGKEANLTANGNVAVADKGTGAYVDGTGVETVTINGNITTGKNALGAYGKNANVTANGNMDVSNGLSIGLVGTGTGDINYSGTATVAAKGSESASIAIYKGAGQGTVNTTGTFDVHEGGYAVYADNLKGATGTITVNNGANINLDKTSVGIYAGGNVNSNNTGTITVGESYLAKADHSVSNDDLNSVGLYGEEGAQVSNSGNINVGFDHSVGVYVKTNTSGTGIRTTFTNNARATITADNGGVGVLAVQYSDVINKGTIIVNQTTTPSCGGKSIGVALYSMSTFDNQGEVTINGGYGVFLADATQYVNNGNMTLNNGAAVVGKGTYLNKGTVTIGGVADTSVQAGKVAAVGAEDPVRNGAIAIDNQGNVVINNQYIGSGAIISDYDIILKNPTIDITGKPSFIANSVSGEISLAPNFINTGNGYSWTVNGFVPKAMNSGLQGKPTINTSPLFMAHMSGQDLLVAKQPYAYLVAGSQFDNLYNGVDSLLALDQSGTSNDSTVLKQLNSYLDTIYNEQGQTAFQDETDRTLAEMRGDIYSTTYKRMENIQTSFDNAFDELLNARNASKDSGKFSVIYQQGEYNDDTLGVDDYDYRVTGLMYMREVESRNYGSKHGFSLGFTVSRFDFDDAPTFHDKSKEDVYSLRAGLHNVHSFGEDGANDRLRLISRLELGYNRHEAVRTIELDKVYKNKGNYNSMNVSLDNKLEATIYRDLKTDVKVYGAINLEYGYMGKFTERAKGDSALELTVKGQHYYSVEPEVGVNASRRAYLGKKVSVKVFGDLAYGYELGNVGKKHRKAKVNGGTEGYYNLIKPAEEKGRAKATVGLTIEKPNGFGVTGEVQFRKHQNKSDNDVRYGVRFNYTF